MAKMFNKSTQSSTLNYLFINYHYYNCCCFVKNQLLYNLISWSWWLLLLLVIIINDVECLTTSSVVNHHQYYPSSSQHHHAHHYPVRRGHHQQILHAGRHYHPSDDEVNFSLSQEDYEHDNVDGSRNVDLNPNGSTDHPDVEHKERLPEFVSQVPNVTVQIGREARLACVVKNLASYRTAWIRDEEKSILTLQRQMVTRDPRIMLQEESQIDTTSDYLAGHGNGEPSKIRYFVLIIRNVQFSDRGGYMCQINTVPMRSQIGYLSVVVPPDIIDHESSNDVMVREGENVTLKCKARGHPEPEIEWRREDGARVPLGDRNNHNGRVMVNKTEGELLEITRVTRVHSGAWLCIASNGVMPSVSRRILLNVQFTPQIWIPTEEIGSPFGSNITLDCHIEAYPLPLNYWTFGVHSESIYISGPKYEVTVKEKGYKRHLKLTIQRLTEEDLGIYKCHAQNSLGRQVKQVRIYASDRHQQIESIKPSLQHQTSIKSSSSNYINNHNNNSDYNNQKSSKRKKKRRKNHKNNSTLTSSQQNNGFLYNVINSFGRQTTTSTNKANNDIEIYDSGDNSEDFEDGDEEYSEFHENHHYSGAIHQTKIPAIFLINIAIMTIQFVL